MKISIPAIVLALAASVYAECRIPGSVGTIGDTRCCWGGDQGNDACLRQTSGVDCTNGAQDKNFCRFNGVTTCDADCCDIKTGRGQPCPKGKNRCDKDSGCPYRDFNTGDLRG